MGLHETRYRGLLGWFDSRMPSVMNAFRVHMSEYYAPKNFNFWYFFGSLALVVLLIQLISGLFLAMHYKPDSNLAFWSVEFIMREVSGGWFIRYMHSTGASFFFIVVYAHIFRGMIYGSHRKPREVVWLAGSALFLSLMAESFFGYLLPWGQMSYWGAQVIINLFDSIPVIGPGLSTWIRGDFVIGDATLNRFFALHVFFLPLVLIGIVVAHIFALHDVGSNNPDGIEIKDHLGPDGRPLDGIPFHPYYTVHDMYGIGFFLMAFFAVVFFAPDLGGVFLEGNNFIPADPLQTPLHIAPLWYFTPYYSILRATTEGFLHLDRAVCVCLRRAGVLQRSRPAPAHRHRRDHRGDLGAAGGTDPHGRQTLGGRAHGLVGDDPLRVALAGPLTRQVDALPACLASRGAGSFCGGILRTRGARHDAAQPGPNGDRAVLRGDLFRILRADALVEPDGSIQARAGPRALRSALMGVFE